MAVEVLGADAILRDIEKATPMRSNVDEWLKDGGAVIAGEMRGKAPVRTGKMKAAINVGSCRYTKRGRTVTVGIHRRDFVGEEDYYPAFVEYGHGGPHPAPPHPFIRPAWDAKRNEAWTKIKEGAVEHLKKKGL